VRAAGPSLAARFRIPPYGSANSRLRIPGKETAPAGRSMNSKAQLRVI